MPDELVVDWSCKAFKAAWMREYRKKNPERMRRIDLKKRFGITLEQFNIMLANQNYGCALCQQPETKLDWRSKQVLPLSVDHCHTTGKIRGLLCSDCNRAIGMLHDDVEVLARAISYLTA